MDKYRFGEFIYNRRTSLNLTQDELGRKLGVTNKAVSKWEVGETLPDINLMQNLANILEVSIDELYACEVKSKPLDSEINSNLIKAKTRNFKSIIAVLCLIIVGLTGIVIGISYDYNNYKSRQISAQRIILNADNYSHYLVLTPSYRVDNVEDHMKIYGSVTLANNIEYVSKVDISITYSIQYYYLTTDDQVSLINYLSKDVDVVYDNTLDEVTFVLEVQPVNKLDNFKEFKEYSLSYKISSISGEVIYHLGD